MNNQDNGMQKRMLLMTLIVFVFFIAYEFLVLKPQQEEREAAKKIELAKQAPEIKQNMNMTSSSMSKDISSLSSKAVN